jgi:hypothetical protein
MSQKQNLKILRLKEEMFISSESIALEANSFIEEIDKILATERDMLRRANLEGMREGVAMLAKDMDERAYQAYCNSEIEILGYGDGSTKLLKLKVDHDAV